MIEERNPNHPITRTVHDHWHKIAAMIMLKLGLRIVTITHADLVKFAGEDIDIVLHEHDKVLDIKLVSKEEGERLAREEGGLPH